MKTINSFKKSRFTCLLKNVFLKLIKKYFFFNLLKRYFGWKVILIHMKHVKKFILSCKDMIILQKIFFMIITLQKPYFHIQIFIWKLNFFLMMGGHDYQKIVSYIDFHMKLVNCLYDRWIFMMEWHDYLIKTLIYDSCTWTRQLFFLIIDRNKYLTKNIFWDLYSHEPCQIYWLWWVDMITLQKPFS